MSIDPIEKVIGLKNAYGRTRGYSSPTGKLDPVSGQLLIAPGKGVPRTTWEDIVIASAHIKKHLDPDLSQCSDILVKHKGMDRTRAMQTCTFGSREESPMNFIHTAGYSRRKSEWEKTTPSQAFGQTTVAQKVGLNEIYPRNEEFWGQAVRFALERSAAGAVPYWDEIAIESIKEAINEAPAKIRDAFNAVTPDLSKYAPAIVGLADIVKWGSIGGGLFLLYWYVLRGRGE